MFCDLYQVAVVTCSWKSFSTSRDYNDVVKGVTTDIYIIYNNGILPCKLIQVYSLFDVHCTINAKLSSSSLSWKSFVKRPIPSLKILSDLSFKKIICIGRLCTEVCYHTSIKRFVKCVFSWESQFCSVDKRFFPRPFYLCYFRVGTKGIFSVKSFVNGLKVLSITWGDMHAVQQCSHVCCQLCR